MMRLAKVWMMAALAAGVMALPMMPVPMLAQSATPAVDVRQAGTVKSTDATGLTLTTAGGQDITVTVPAAAKVLVVAPGSRDLKSATAGTLSDVAAGDRVLVIGTATEGAAGASSAAAGTAGVTAARVILMKAQAIAQTHEAEDAAWAHGTGGIVKSVDAGTGTIVIASGLKKLTVLTTPQTVVKRYSGSSVKFADAVASTVAAIRPGDQLRVRGTKSPDGSEITADAVVAGTFHNYSGLITAVDPAAGTVTLKDLATKKTVTVAVSANSDVRRIPPMLAERVAMQVKGGAASHGEGQAGAGGHGEGQEGAAGNGVGAGVEHPAGVDEGARREGRAGMDLSQMLSRLPTETLGGLKVGDAVMIVATSPAANSGTPTAVTLLAGVNAILTASPSGETMTLSPWSMGGGGEGEDGGTDEGGPAH